MINAELMSVEKARNLHKSSVLQVCRRDQLLPGPVVRARIASMTQIHNVLHNYNYN